MKEKSPLYKLLSGIYQRKDIDNLGTYINTKEGEEEFQELSQIIWEESLTTDIDTKHSETKKLFSKLKIKRKHLVLYFSAAVSVVLLFLVGSHLYYASDNAGADIRDAANRMISSVDAQEIKLILSDKEPIEVSAETVNIKHETTGVVKINEDEFVQDNTSDENKKEYNTLIVPKGKRSTLQLTDDIFIWVNAGTNVVYPADIEKGGREIFVEGEVFVHVKPQADKANRKSFIVRTHNMNVEVTGTEFNVASYKEENSESVVLVTGSVNVKTNGKRKEILNPNEQFIYNVMSEEVIIEEVDVENYISWKNGFYQFSGEVLGVIVKRLERYYGVTIDISAEASILSCYGRLDLKDNILTILDGLSYTVPIAINQTTEKQFVITLKNNNAYER